MTRAIAVLALAVGLAVPAAAEGKRIPDADWQGLQATFALMESAQRTSAGNFYQDFCRRLKRNRWTCSIRITKPDEGIACSVTALVGPRWWRFPPELFGCPAEWNPGASWLQPQTPTTGGSTDG